MEFVVGEISRENNAESCLDTWDYKSASNSSCSISGHPLEGPSLAAVGCQRPRPGKSHRDICGKGELAFSNV